MLLNLNTTLATQYKNQSQAIRVMTEDWVKNQIYCPNCGNFISDFENNKPVADFYCSNCSEEYELKSKKDDMGRKIVDGAFETMLERLKSTNNPSFFFLNYNIQHYLVQNFVVIPKHFFIPDIIEKRKPLSESAKRAGWVGCNILIQNIPKSGKIFYLKEGKPVSKKDVLTNWNKTLFLRDSKDVNLRGWILDVMNCIDNLNKEDFTLNEIYNFESILSEKHPDNKHIKDKIRQQLQLLRDRGYVEFMGKGKYRLN